MVDDAIASVQSALELNDDEAKPLLLMARLLRDRAVIRETQEQYTTDLRGTEDCRRQYLAVGGHLGEKENGVQ
jgi:hypothetical protein